MTIRPKFILELCVVLLPVASSIAQIQTSGATPSASLAATAPTVVPALIPFSGVALDRDGHPLSGETGITFLFYKDQTGGEPLLTETQSVVPDPAGHYTVHLGASRSSGIPVDLFGSGETRWLEVQIAGEATQPRTLFTSVPYALKAADAATLGGYPASAFLLAGSAAQPSVTSAIHSLAAAAVTNVTTTGGTTGVIPVFSGTTSVINSKLYYTGGFLGIGKTPTVALDILGTTDFGGQTVYLKTSTATTATGYPSHSLQFQTSGYNSSSAAAVSPYLEFEGEIAGNNTSLPTASLHLLSGSGTGLPGETGLYFNHDGTIHFATGQTFPGGTGGGGSTGAPVCVAVDGGFGGGGTTFVGPTITIPAGGGCTPWSGFTKTAGTVVLFTSGTACLSTDAKKLTVSVSSADPDFLGVGSTASDFIQLTRASTTGTFTSGSDQGYFSGSAVQVTCSSSLLTLNENND